MSGMPQKVFCIGFHKTGTSTMAEVFRTLGYCWYNKRQNPTLVQQLTQGDFSLAKELVATYDAWSDDPTAYLYQHLDKWHPDSKFVLTIREPQQWITSMCNYFTNEDSVWRKFIYDGQSVPKGNEDLYLNVYNDHCHQVQQYFKDRPHQLLVIDITKQPEWEPICSFLNRPVPNVPFPHVNASPFSLGTVKKTT